MQYANFLPASVPPESWGVSLREDRRSIRARILVVGECSRSRGELLDALAGFTHEFVEVCTTADAIEAISLQRVDLVLIDLVAPQQGSIELCRMLKKAAAIRFLPVFVTANSDDLEHEVRAIEAGADEFLLKPLRPRAVEARIQAGLRHKAMIDSMDDSETVLLSLAESVEERDPALGHHCERLAVMAAGMGVALALPTPDIIALERAGFLHDVGKVAIPDQILFKEGPLTPSEWTIMKSHAERGVRICSKMRSLALVVPIIRHHHEKWDGSGYPNGLKGEQIPLLARIFQLADIYDALTTARSYKRAFEPKEAVQIIKEESKKGWRDPQLVEQFADLLPTFSTAPLPDFSKLSLHALAASLERFGTEHKSGPINQLEALRKQTESVNCL